MTKYIFLTKLLKDIEYLGENFRYSLDNVKQSISISKKSIDGEGGKVEAAISDQEVKQNHDEGRIAVKNSIMDLVNQESEFFFRKQADDNLEMKAQKLGINGSKATSQKSGIARVMDKYIWCTDYPEELTKPSDIMKEYFRRRTPPHFKANVYQLIGLGVCAVISGEFSGWNGGMKESGYFGFWIANLLSAIMYLGIAGSLAELSATLPVYFY